MLALAAALLGAALGPWLARSTVRLATRDRTGRPGARRVVVTAVLTAGLCAGTAGLTGARPVLAGLLWVASAAVVLGGVDLAVHRLPDAVTLPAAGVLTASVALDAVTEGSGPRALDALWCAVAAFAVAAGARLLSPGGLGFGDVKLLGLLGGVLGWWGGGGLLVTGVFLGLVVGALAALGLVVLRRAGWRTAIPFGPPLLVGAVAAVALAGPL